MKRLAVLLAFSAMGTGCVVDEGPHSGNVNVYWEFARNAPAVAGGFLFYDTTDPPLGTPDGNCLQSDVDQVSVLDPAGSFQTVTCVFGGVLGLQFQGVPGGTFTTRVQGFRNSILVYDSGFVDIHVDGSVSRVVDAVGISAPLDLFGDFGFGTFASNTLAANCADAGTPNVTFTIKDVFGTTITGGLVGCDDPLPSPVFASSLDLDNFWVRMTGAGTTTSDSYDSCWQPLDHFANDTGTLGFSYLMVTTPGTCPTVF